jgi:hypothetical protein
MRKTFSSIINTFKATLGEKLRITSSDQKITKIRFIFDKNKLYPVLIEGEQPGT